VTGVQTCALPISGSLRTEVRSLHDHRHLKAKVLRLCGLVRFNLSASFVVPHWRSTECIVGWVGRHVTVMRSIVRQPV
jgi:hypothetical protein